MKTLDKNALVSISGLIFLVVAILHGLRAINSWELVYNGWAVPLWISWTVAIVGLYIAYNAFNLKK